MQTDADSIEGCRLSGRFTRRVVNELLASGQNADLLAGGALADPPVSEASVAFVGTYGPPAAAESRASRAICRVPWPRLVGMCRR